MTGQQLKDRLFTERQELEFKRNFVIQFLAAKAAKDFDHNCMHGWENAGKPPVEDAKHLADKAWTEWVDTIGLAKLTGRL